MATRRQFTSESKFDVIKRNEAFNVAMFSIVCTPRVNSSDFQFKHLTLTVIEAE